MSLIRTLEGIFNRMPKFNKLALIYVIIVVAFFCKIKLVMEDASNVLVISKELYLGFAAHQVDVSRY
ncbi:hypothetical protein L2E82_40282 [Cichorium intybus]|uniref:Uncharacterized protein n=1 Tax=Cichorium intybus TaxID=13427 RepID=A0ACB9ALI6_CICIN|nr:hypothetical protein L2E82_40282 [Cichorium intybus]